METKAVNFSLPPTLKHGYIVSSASRKVDTLRRCIHGIDAQKTLVFMNYQQRLQDTVYKLAAKKMKVSAHNKLVIVLFASGNQDDEVVWMSWKVCGVLWDRLRTSAVSV